MKKEILIEGMSCGHCSARVEKALLELDGVEKVEVDLTEKKASLKLSREISDEVFKETIDDVGYDVVQIKND